MRSLKYLVLALTPMLGAGGFAQGLGVGMNEAVSVQTQVPAQPKPSADPMSAEPSAAREKGSDRAGIRTSGEGKRNNSGSNASDREKWRERAEHRHPTAAARGKTPARGLKKNDRNADVN